MKEKKSEHVLICISPSPSNQKVIRAAAKMAKEQNADLTALYVETPGNRDLDGDKKEQLAKNVALAKKLGAHIATTYGNNVAYQIAYYANKARVTRLVIGRPNRHHLLPFCETDIIKQLMQKAPSVEIFIIPDNLPPYKPKRSVGFSGGFSLKSLLIMLVLVSVATIIGLLLVGWGFSESNIIMVYILSVLFTALWTKGRIYGVIASLLSVFVFNFFFTEPRFTFHAYETGYPLTFLVMFIAAIVTSSLTAKSKLQSKENALKAHQTEILLTASQNLHEADSFEDILSEAARLINKLLDSPIVATPIVDGKIKLPIAVSSGGQEQIDLSEKDRNAIDWVYQNNSSAGATKDKFSDCAFTYLPVCAKETIHAVIGIMAKQDKPADAFEKNLVMALLGECASALEKQRLHEKEKELILTAQQEKLRSNLLRSISHDLRTPLTTISGNADMLINDKVNLSEQQKKELYTHIYDDSVWLIDLVENLLSITRMDEGRLILSIKPEVVSDVIDEAVEHICRRNKDRTIRVVDSDEIIMAHMDAPLIIQVLVNLLDNAIKYTPKDSEIVVCVTKENDKVYVSVQDSGNGISQESKGKIFDMFYTDTNPRSDSRRGMGLGLALCKTILLAHGGNISVHDNTPKGTVFTFTLNAQEAILDE